MKYFIHLLAASGMIMQSFSSQCQIHYCDGTDLPSWYDMYGGSTQFTQHTQDAIHTFVTVEEAIEIGDYGTAKAAIEGIFATYPRGGNIWWNVFNAPRGANLGTPHAYYGLRMMEDIIAYHTNPNTNANTKTARMKVVLVGCSEGVQPRNEAELFNGTGVSITNSLNPSLVEDDYCIIDQSLSLFRKYITAITNGHLDLEVEYVQLPNVCMDVNVTSAAPFIASGSVGPVWDALDNTDKSETDFFWIIYPSHVPDFPAFDNYSFITGGMGSDSKGGPTFIIDDKWLVRKPAHLGKGPYNDIERRIYLPQWLQHEFFHHLYRIYPEFALEVNGHDWFNLSFWPDDFEGRFEPDFYAESLHKRLQKACTPLSVKLITSNTASQVNLAATTIASELVGAYSLDNIGNNWHEGNIINENGTFFWRNKAGVKWEATPNLEKGILETGPDCPYPGQDFKIQLHRTSNGEVIPGIEGLVFQGDFFRKRFDMIRGEVPYEVTLGDYTTTCGANPLGNGTIIKENGQYYWQENSGMSWSLITDASNEGFVMGPDSPDPGSRINLIIAESVCGFAVKGIAYQDHYYWRPKLDLNNPSPTVADPQVNLNLPINFGTHIIALSSIFEDDDTLSYYVTNTTPTTLNASVNGNNLILEGGTEGIFSLCVSAVDINGGVAVHQIDITVGEPSSVTDVLNKNTHIYPNPTDGMLHISTPLKEYECIVYDAASKVLMDRKGLTDNATMDIQSLVPGVYYIKIVDVVDGHSLYRRVIKL